MSNDFFIPGKISVILDASAGSSGKGKIGSFVTKTNVGNYHFVCNTFASQASHIVMDKSYPEFCYKQFNSCAHRHEEFEKMYIGHGAVITLKPFFEELKQTGIPKEKIGISPLTAICQDIDRLYEEGKVNLDGSPVAEHHDGTISTGSTCSGVGVARARRVLRDKKILLAKDVPELQPFICDVTGEILERLALGQSGLGECAQGFQLSNGYKFYPNCTARNVTVAGFLDDMFLPITVIGNVMLNLRTYPIRIASKKYISQTKWIALKTTAEQIQEAMSPGFDEQTFILSMVKEAGYDPALITGKNKSIVSGTLAPVFYVEVAHPGQHLTYDEVTSGEYTYMEKESYSGDGYEDQKEITWDQIEQQYGKEIPKEVKLTSLTKLMRRVFTFSQKNLEDAIIYNQTPHSVFLSLNFVNWIDGSTEGVANIEQITEYVWDWVTENVEPVTRKFENVRLKYLGTGRYTEETVELFYGE